MKITDIIKCGEKRLSFEVFPPKSSSSFESVRLATEEIASLSPSFMSVTYGAGGGTSKYTLEIARNIHEKYSVPSLAHLTCVSSTKETVAERIYDMKMAGIRNVMALRGDIPKDMEYSDPTQDLHISLKAGKTRLNGERAEQFVRYRSGYVNADLGRLDAQKLFLSAFAKKCRSLTFTQILRVMGLVLTGVQTDIGLPAAIRTVQVLMECDTDCIPMATLSGQPVRGKSGAWYYVLNRRGAIRMMRDYMMAEAEAFDKNAIFDRESNSEFHAVYHAREEELPIS